MTTPSNRPWHRFLLRAFLFFLPFGLLVGAGELTLLRGGELTGIAGVLEDQESGGAQFMRAFMEQELQRYKYRGLTRRQVRVAVLGSSRVLDMRQPLFPVPIYNGGGVLQRASDLFTLAATWPLFGTTPEVVLLSQDPWWFNSGYTPPAAPLEAVLASTEAVYDWQAHWRALRQLVLRSARQPGRTWSLIRRGSADHYGYFAATSGGFRPDGSRDRHLEQIEQTEFVDRERPPFAERVRRGSHQFVRPNSRPTVELALFRVGVAQLRASGVEVVVYVPPICEDARRELLAAPGWDRLWPELRKLLSAALDDLGSELHWWADATSLGLDDRYMVDCIHQGEKLAAAELIRVGETAGAHPILRATAAHVRELEARSPPGYLEIGIDR